MIELRLQILNIGYDGNTQIGTNNNVFVSKYNAAGSKQWTTQFGSADADAQANRITADSLGNLFVASTVTLKVGNAVIDGVTLIGQSDTVVTKISWDGVKQ